MCQTQHPEKHSATSAKVLLSLMAMDAASRRVGRQPISYGIAYTSVHVNSLWLMVWSKIVVIVSVDPVLVCQPLHTRSSHHEHVLGGVEPFFRGVHSRRVDTMSVPLLTRPAGMYRCPANADWSRWVILGLYHVSLSSLPHWRADSWTPPRSCLSSCVVPLFVEPTCLISLIFPLMRIC